MNTEVSIQEKKGHRVLGCRCTSFFPLSPFVLWQPGPSGPAESVGVCAVRVGDGEPDSNAEEHVGSCMGEHYVSLRVPVWSAEPMGNISLRVAVNLTFYVI